MTDALDDGDEMVPEEWPTLYTPVPVWVLLSGSTAQAYRMYAFLGEHINNRTPGERIAFPSQKAIARALGLKDYRDVAKYRDELAALGAIRFKEFRYAGGMRRRYRYWVRFNPPEGFAGLVSLAQFYEANPDVKAKRQPTARDIAMEETAGGDGGGKKPTSEGGENPTSQGGESPTAQQPDPVEPDQGERNGAPAARSANDGRQASTGSRARAKSGSAASGKSTPPRLTPQQNKAVAGFIQELPEDVRTALVPKHPPMNLKQAILGALAAGEAHSRTPQQLVAYRVGPKWMKHYASLHYAGQLARPVGALVEMLKRSQECGSDRCDERMDVDSAEACRSCEQRAVDKRADREAAREHPLMSEPAATVPSPADPTPTPPPLPDLPPLASGAKPNNHYRQMRALTTGQRRR